MCLTLKQFVAWFEVTGASEAVDLFKMGLRSLKVKLGPYYSTRMNPKLHLERHRYLFVGAFR